MKDYHINIFYSDEDGAYIADIPDLEAGSAFGELQKKLWQRWKSPKLRGLKRRAGRESRFQNHAIDL